MIKLLISLVFTSTFPVAILSLFLFDEWYYITDLFVSLTPATFGFLAYLGLTLASYIFLARCFIKFAHKEKFPSFTFSELRHF